MVDTLNDQREEEKENRRKGGARKKKERESHDGVLKELNEQAWKEIEDGDDADSSEGSHSDA